MDTGVAVKRSAEFGASFGGGGFGMDQGEW